MNEQLQETNLMPKDEPLREMEKIWITLSPSQKEALLQEATRASHLNQAIARFRATKMDR